MQNKDDIQNQHKKLHRIMYILPKNILHQNSTCRGPQGKNLLKAPWGGVQVEF